MASQRDQYANIANASAAVEDGTINFTEILTGISLGQGKGIVIDQIDYSLSISTLQAMDTDGDLVQFAWTASNSITTLELDQKSVIHKAQLNRVHAGTPANAIFIENPYIYQFFPPIIFASPRIYLAAKGTGLTAGFVKSRLYFRYVDLSAQEYLEIAESFVLVG